MSEKDEMQTPEVSEEETYTGILGDYEETEEAAEEAPAPAEEEAPTQEAAPKKSGKKAGAIVGICAGVLAIAAIGGIGIWQMKTNPAKAPLGVVDPANDAAYSEHIGVSKDMMQYFYYDYIELFRAYYGEDMLSANYGLDLSQPLRSQEGPNGDGTSWYDLIMEQATANVKQELVLSEAGRAAGFEMSDADRKAVDDGMADIDLSAYGEGMTEEAARQAMEMNAYAAAYYNKVFEDMAFTDEEIEAYFSEHESEYVSCGLCGYNIYFDEETEEETSDEDTTAETEAVTEEEGAEETTEDDKSAFTKEMAEDCLAQFKKVKSVDEFKELAISDLVDHQGYTEDDARAEGEYSIVRDGYTYVEGAELSEWAFGGEAKVGDVYVIESPGLYSVYYMFREPSRDETATIDVRHILFSVSDYLDGDSSEATDEELDAAFEKARAEAQSVLDQWKAGEATEESFGELATAYTDDPGSQTTGGLYSGVTEGQMVQTFNDWCFDPARKTGDTDLVETDYGVHVMYFVGQGDPSWKLGIINQLKNTTFTTWYSEQETLYPITVNAEIIQTIGE